MTKFSLISSFDSADLRGPFSLSEDGSILATSNITTNSVKVYRINNGNLEQLGSDLYGEVEDESGSNSRSFGSVISLSSDGSVLAVGAPNSNNYTGLVRLYRYINDEWIQLGSDITGGSNFDQSGHSISLSSDGLTVAIGSPIHDPNSGRTNSDGEVEHVHIFHFIDNEWKQLGNKIDGAGFYEFGKNNSLSLSSDGSIVAIGSPHGTPQNRTINGFGSVGIYKIVDGDWSKVKEFTGAYKNANFGDSISLSADGSILAVGASDAHWPWITDQNYVEVYKKTGLYSDGVQEYERWERVGGRINGNWSAENFGSSVSLSSDGNILAVGGERGDVSMPTTRPRFCNYQKALL